MRGRVAIREAYGPTWPAPREADAPRRVRTFKNGNRTAAYASPSRGEEDTFSSQCVPYQLPVASRTMTGQRMTMNSTGKMHTIIGTASLAGRL